MGLFLGGQSRLWVDSGIQFIVFEVGKVLHNLLSHSRSFHRLDLFRKFGHMEFRKSMKSQDSGIFIVFIPFMEEKGGWGKSRKEREVKSIDGLFWAEGLGQNMEVTEYPASQHGVRKTDHQ